ncbi:MAG: Mrp/NBP35 family ATP-binding protein, partial [Flavobacteriaceae bacterium]|nr:Mrp/NBP35 family ATP-binding protein [Flavobacteriaceae bacterium]
MKLKKEAIIQALETLSVPGEGKSIIEAGALKNMQIFGDEVVLDLVIGNPSLQARKKLEVEILKTIHDQVYEKAKITINVKVEAKPAPKVPSIKGKPIPGIQNIVAVASGKGGVGKFTITAN